MKNCLCVITLLLLFFPASSFAKSAPRPNILWIVSDDQGFGDLSSLGHPVLKTPHLDQLKNESVWLRNFYVAPLCAPTRASLLTGRHQFRTGVWDTWNSRSNMAADEVTAAEYLSPAGYATAQIGKWHLGENYPFRPIDQGFQHGFVWNNLDRFAPTFDKNGVTTAPYNGFLDDVVADEAIRFISQKRDRPFFAYVPFFLPHTFWGKQVPDSDVRQFADVPGLTPADREVMAMLVNLDRNVGRLLAALNQNGLAENTVVIFHSDNGLTGRQSEAAKFNAGLRGQKQTVYEGGIRVPCFVRLPGKLKPRTITTRAAAVDWLPTFLEIAGIRKHAKPLDGVSLWPLLTGTQDSFPQRFIVQQQQPQKSGQTPQPFVNAAIIGPRYKLVFPKDEATPELYDLEQDEGEQRNLAAEQPVIVAEMKAAYMNWYASVTRERGFAPLRAHIGNSAQPVFRESMIQVDEKKGLPLQVERAGVYRVELRQVQTDLFPHGGALGLTDGKQVWQAEVRSDTKAVSFSVTLPKGSITLVPWSKGRHARQGYVPLGDDPGCRELVIRGPEKSVGRTKK
jgi:arylsulfatase A-like enzyme